MRGHRLRMGNAGKDIRGKDMNQQMGNAGKANSGVHVRWGLALPRSLAAVALGITTRSRQAQTAVPVPIISNIVGLAPSAPADRRCSSSVDIPTFQYLPRADPLRRRLHRQPGDAERAVQRLHRFARQHLHQRLQPLRLARPLQRRRRAVCRDHRRKSKCQRPGAPARTMSTRWRAAPARAPSARPVLRWPTTATVRPAVR